MTFFIPNHWNLLNDFEKRVKGSRCDCQPGDEASWTPAVDVFEESDQVVIIADVAGVAPEQIDVSTEKGILTIKGERIGLNNPESVEYRRRERRGGSFERSFRLSDTVDVEQISAKCEYGQLEIRLPKKAAVQPRNIPVTH